MTVQELTKNQSLSVQEIMDKIPHRYPFLLIDKVTNWVDQHSITAYKNVSVNEPFFQGHFPGTPVMPGVLILEAMAQAAGILAYLSDKKTYKDYLFYLAGVENARFKKMVVPGDVLRFEITFKAKKSKFLKVQAQAFVDDSLVCTADLMSAQGI